MTDPLEDLRREVVAAMEADHAALMARLDAQRQRMPGNATVWLQSAQVLLAHALEHAGAAGLAPALAAAQQACALAPASAEAHALRGRCLDAMDRPAEALAAFESACAPGPEARGTHGPGATERAVREAYAATLAVERLPDAAARARLRQAADALGIELPATGDTRALLTTHFVHARNHFDSGLRQACDRIRRRLGGQSLEQVMTAELAEARRALRDAVRPADVPAPLRPLVAWARRFGVGDDGLRGLALARATDVELERMVHDVDPRADSIDDWLDRQDMTALSPAAAAFARLRQAVEEARAMGRAAWPGDRAGGHGAG